MNTIKQQIKTEATPESAPPQSKFPILTWDQPKTSAKSRQFLHRYSKRRNCPTAPKSPITLVSEMTEKHLAEFLEWLPLGRDEQMEFLEEQVWRVWRLIVLGDDIVAREEIPALQQLLAFAENCTDSFKSRVNLYCEGLLRDIGTSVPEAALLHSKWLVDAWADQKDKLNFYLALLADAEQHRVLSHSKSDKHIRKAHDQMHAVCNLVIAELGKRKSRPDEQTAKLFNKVLFEAIRRKFRIITKHAQEYDDPQVKPLLQKLRELTLELGDHFITLEFLREEIYFLISTGNLEEAKNRAERMEDCLGNIETLSPYTDISVQRSKIELEFATKGPAQAALLASPYADKCRRHPILYDLAEWYQWCERGLSKYTSTIPELTGRSLQRPVYTTPVITLIFSDSGFDFIRL